ncbi:MAG TPA: class I SAM-dependent methyltransferase [Longimicrobium sp.]|jgi:methyltransferase (TIGR00027 family)
MSIENVSDTARWVAVYRAMETERPDAHFRDPWARRLAGARGEEIVRELPGGAAMAWAMIVRTAVMDEVILDTVRRHGVGLVLNLAAGLDTRAWRLELPAALRWVDVDLPGILSYKTEVMRSETPRCRYEAAPCDLTVEAERSALFSRLGRDSRSALVVTEGLLMYLGEDEVGALASALAAEGAFQWWLTDLASPMMLELATKRWGKQLGRGNAPFRFGPAAGPAFFEPFGWREELWRSMVDEARRLRREMRGTWFRRIVFRFLPSEKKEQIRRFQLFLLMRRTGSETATSPVDPR